MEATESEKKTQCPFCATTFSHRSSLIRHLRKKCNQPQPQTVRRKACTQCVTDKTRCNLKRPSCSRCSMRQIPCHYIYHPDSSSSLLSPEKDETSPTLQVDPSVLPKASGTPVLQEPQTPADSSSLFDLLFSDPSNWDLTLANEFNPFLSPRRDSTALIPNQTEHMFSSDLIEDFSTALRPPTPKTNTESPAAALATHSMEFIFRVLRSWPRMLAEDFQTPPIIHHTQIADSMALPQTLANCITLVKMWHGQCQGAEAMVHRLIVSEVDTLLVKFEELDEQALLAVLQATTIYLIILLFPTGTARPTLPEANLFRRIQDLVNYSAGTGLFLPEEREQMRPTWSAWVHVTAKRRAVLALYLLRFAYSVFHNVPPFNCRELGFMPAPAARVLWHAQTEQEWNSLYIKWLARWSGHVYIQGEFDRIQPGIKMEDRAEKWLEETDEFGMIMMSIVNATDYRYPVFSPLPH
ncbi:hypothetical protein BDW59DRAFT_35202 [Aspergillus cavernicola]|uniref:Zn(2)-C6 fungal-type domain-containing protein n=1 Tax=Aspergillus cavernicola TaxID=176166 RepID=A0ABR4HCD8_9EURO